MNDVNDVNNGLNRLPKWTDAMNTQNTQLNSLSGPTTYDAPWNPAYTEYLHQSLEMVGQLRGSIAIHGTGHALIQLLSGVRDIALRMPSFTDTPHVEAIVPLRTPLPCGSLPRKQVDQLLSICYHLSSYWAEDIHNQGEFRGVAGFDDIDKAFDLADALAHSLREHPARIVTAASLVVQAKLGAHWGFIEDISKRLMHIGFIGSEELAQLSRNVPQCNLATAVLTQLNDPALDEEIDDIQKRLA